MRVRISSIGICVCVCRQSKHWTLSLAAVDCLEVDFSRASLFSAQQLSAS